MKKWCLFGRTIITWNTYTDTDLCSLFSLSDQPKRIVLFCICAFVEFVCNRRSDPLPESGVSFLLRFALTNASEIWICILSHRSQAQRSGLRSVRRVCHWRSQPGSQALSSLPPLVVGPRKAERREPEVVMLSAHVYVFCDLLRTATCFMR